MSIEYVSTEDEDYRGYEIYELLNGSGQITLRGDSNERGILFEGKPISFNWADCQGSIGQYLIRGMKYEEYQESLEKIRNFVNYEENIDAPLSVVLHDLLQLFTDGQYLLKEYLLDEDYEYLAYDASLKPHNYYPYKFTLVGTQPEKYLNKKRVDEYIALIKSGVMPRVIVASVYDDGTFYVLDGHHKLEAYKQLDKKPNIIEIVSVEAKPLTLDDGLLFIEDNGAKKIYTKVKNEYFGRYEEKKFRFMVGNKRAFFEAIEAGDKIEVEGMLTKDSTLLIQPNVHGLLPIHFASTLAQNETLETMLKFTEDIDIKDKKGNGILHYSVFKDEHMDTIKLLHKKGANLDISNREKETPLESAIGWGSFKIAKLLLELGANPKLSTRDLIASASCREDAVEMIEVLTEYGIKPTKYHQRTILNPLVRVFLDNYFLELDGVGGNIVYEKIEKDISSLGLDCILSSQSKYPLTIRTVIEWTNQDIFEAEVIVSIEDSFDIGFISTDYRKNRTQYSQGGKQEVYLSGVAKNIKFPIEVEENYIKLFGKLEESDYHLWSYYEDDKYEVSVLGKVLSIKEFICEKKSFQLIEVKTKIGETDDKFFILPIVVEDKNLEIKKLKVGDIIDGTVLLQGYLK